MAAEMQRWLRPAVRQLSVAASAGRGYLVGLRRGKRWHSSATLALHADGDPELAAALSTAFDVAPPLSVTSTFESGGFHSYGRSAGPLRHRCEAVLASIEGTASAPAECVLYASGLGASFAAMAALQPKRVLISGGYHGTHLSLGLLKRLAGGSTPAVAELLPPSELQPGDLVWLETPKNPTCEVADIAAYVAGARACAAPDEASRPKIVVDSTFAPPPLQRALELGADVVMHSATKYLAGHSDVICGALCVAQGSELRPKLLQDRDALGSIPGSLELWLLLRSLRSLHVRVERQATTAAKLAKWLDAAIADKAHPLHGHVRAVHHPSLPSSASYEVARRQMAPGLYGGCMALELATEVAAQKLPDQLRLFRHATSLGGVESLAEWRRRYDSAVSPYLVRLSIGLEDPEDLRQDLEQAVLALA